MINVTRSTLPSFEEYTREIKSIWDSHWLTNNGIKHQELETMLKESFKIDYLSLFTNGHLALEAIWAALDFPKGSEVITTPFTFVSTISAIKRNGLTPVFCDINLFDYTIDASKIESLITPKTVAICPVHVYGNICDNEAIEKIAKKHGLVVVYDAAHAFGENKNGVSISNIGDFVMFSFHATKVFNTIEGGMVCCKSKLQKEKLDKLKNFGISGPEQIDLIGGNAKMNEFQAAMGLCNLRHLAESIELRKNAYNRYILNLSNINGIKLNTIQNNIDSNYAYFPVVFDNYKYTRDEIFEKLRQNGIIARKYFYPLISSIECYGGSYKLSQEQLPNATYISDNVLTLPLYSGLADEDVDIICNIIKD